MPPLREINERHDVRFLAAAHHHNESRNALYPTSESLLRGNPLGATNLGATSHSSVYFCPRVRSVYASCVLFDLAIAQTEVVAPNSLTQVWRYIPTTIAATKAKIGSAPEASEV